MNPGDRAAWWIGNLTLTDDFRGKPFRLREWQSEGIIKPLFGTLNPAGKRQYKRCFLFLPRKQAKTQLSAGIGTFCLLGEKKEGQEIVCAASDRDQASKLFNKIDEMIDADGNLKRQVRVYSSKKRIETKKTSNYIQVVSSEGRRQHGGNPSVLLFDELHTQPDRRLYDALTSGQATRRERLAILITTAGNVRKSLCHDEYEYACKVRDGIVEDPSYLPIIFEAPREADWTDEAVWHQAMPALGDFADLEYFQDEFRKAKESPSEESKFRQYYLNQWVASSAKWLNRERWAECGELETSPWSLLGRECYAGLDLSNVSDITAFVLVFPLDDGTYEVLCHFWIPRDYAEARDAKGETCYLKWAEQGHITLTDGDFIDYDLIYAQVVGKPARDGQPRVPGIVDLYDLRLILLDPWNSSQVFVKLQAEGVPAETMRQGTVSMNAPTKFLEVLIGRGQLRHGDNPVLNWMADNAVSYRDGNDNVKLDKERSADKIDGMVALVMALAAATGEKPPTPEFTVL